MRRLREASRLKQILDATFKRIDTIDSGIIELQSDFAKYLCVLVSGYVETAVAVIVQEHAINNGSATLQRFVELKTNRFTNANSNKIINFLGSFDEKWQEEINAFLDEDNRRTAIDNIIGNRHKIAHGRDCHVTYVQVCGYYKKVQAVVDKVEELCLGDHKAPRP